MAEGEALAGGFLKLIGSQVFSRLATFGLNQIVTKLLTVEAFGLMSIRFHLINTMILMLGREGFRRGCLRARQGCRKQLRTGALLRLSALSFPLGVLAAVPVLWAFSEQNAKVLAYNKAVVLQGLAALLELSSEPLYILAQARMQISVRVSIEALATVAKVLATLTLLLLTSLPEAISISLAQMVFALAILIGYVRHFWSEYRSHQSNTRAAAASQKGRVGGRDGSAAAMEEDWNRSDLLLCSSFTAQALEKLALAEGTKVAMTWVQSAYEQGIYGLVVNLGSIAARVLLQPFEEAAFLAFSRPQDPDQHPTHRLELLWPLVKLAFMFGGLAVAFGPGNSYPLLHLLYGPKYSQTEAPTALALYCPYMLLLAVNGILEAFVHAVAQGRALAQGHAALIAINVSQTLVTIPFVLYSGTLGMIAADSLGMLLRIAYCTWFILGYQSGSASTAAQQPEASRPLVSKAKEKAVDGTGMLRERQSRAGPPLHRKSPERREIPMQLSKALPSRASCVVLALSFLVSSVCCALLFGKGPMCVFLRQRPYHFMVALAVHAVVQALMLTVTLLVVWSFERDLLAKLQRLKRKQL